MPSVLSAYPTPALPLPPELHERLLMHSFLVGPRHAQSLALSCRYFHLLAGCQRAVLQLGAQWNTAVLGAVEISGAEYASALEKLADYPEAMRPWLFRTLTLLLPKVLETQRAQAYASTLAALGMLPESERLVALARCELRWLPADQRVQAVNAWLDICGGSRMPDGRVTALIVLLRQIDCIARKEQIECLCSCRELVPGFTQDAQDALLAAICLHIYRLAAQRIDHYGMLHHRIFSTPALAVDAPPLSAYLVNSSMAGARERGRVAANDAGRILHALHRLPVPERLEVLNLLIDDCAGNGGAFALLFDSMLGMLCTVLAEGATHREAALAALGRLTAVLTRMVASPEQQGCLEAMLRAACAANIEFQVPMLLTISAQLSASAQLAPVCLACLHDTLPRLDPARQLALLPAFRTMRALPARANFLSAASDFIAALAGMVQRRVLELREAQRSLDSLMAKRGDIDCHALPALLSCIDAHLASMDGATSTHLIRLTGYWLRHAEMRSGWSSAALALAGRASSLASADDEIFIEFGDCLLRSTEAAFVLEGFALLARSALRLPQLAESFSGMRALAVHGPSAESARGFLGLLEAIELATAGGGSQEIKFGILLHAASHALASVEPGPERLNGALIVLSRAQRIESKQRLADLGARLRALVGIADFHRAFQACVVHAGMLQARPSLSPLWRLLQVWRGATAFQGCFNIPGRYRPQLSMHDMEELAVLLRVAIEGGIAEDMRLLAGDIAEILAGHSRDGLLPELFLLLAQACKGMAAKEQERLLGTALGSMADMKREGIDCAEHVRALLLALDALAPPLRAEALVVIAEVMPAKGRHKALRKQLLEVVDVLPESLRALTRRRCEQAFDKIKRRHL